MGGQAEPLVGVAQGMQGWVESVRRELHRIPEVRWNEERTLERVLQYIHEARENARRLQKPAVDIHQAKGGIWVDVTWDERWDRLLLRADVDALAIQEETGLPFASQNAGCMHACGHDVHTAMLLGALKALTEQELPVAHNLRFVFQRAEESPPPERREAGLGSGGTTLVKEGVLAGIREAYALHIWATEETGLFLSRPAQLMANSDALQIEVRCTGGHVASPHQGANAIDIAADIQIALRGFDTRFLGPAEPASLVPSILKSGTARNIRPAQAELWFAVRNVLEPERRHAFLQAITRCVEAVVSRYPDASVTITPARGYAALVNSPACYEKARGLLAGAGQKTVEMDLLMTAEDFAYYLEAQGGVPGSLWFLGARLQGTGGLHTPTFNPDEAVFWRGVLFWLLLACSKR